MTVNAPKRLLACWIAATMCSALTIAQTDFPTGLHRLALLTPGGDLTFGLSLQADADGGLQAFVINGSERIPVPATQAGEDLVLTFPHYDSELRLQLAAKPGAMQGEWIKRRGRGKQTRMRVESREPGPRFVMQSVQGAASSWPSGRYRVAFQKSQDPAVGVFAVTADPVANCTGTFLTTLGDYRFLAGNTNGETFKLSCFDGAHAFLFHGSREADGSIRGQFWSSDSWHEAWTGTPDKKAQLADGWNLTKWRADADLSRGEFRDLSGDRKTLADPAYTGKVRVLEVFGSWCPNCHDHGDYMAELYRRYHGRGLQVIGLAFEHDEDFARCVRQVKAFTARHRADFPILIAGLSDKERASKSLGLLDKIRSFPTTIFLDKEGNVRGIYQGWSGPATKDAHTRLRQRFEALIETLLGED